MNLPTDVSSPLIRQRRSLDILVCMLVVSLLLHLAASLLFILPGSTIRHGSAPVFLELQNLTETAPPAADSQVLKETAASQPAPPETEASPEPQPETAKLEQAVASTLQKAAQSPEAVHESSLGLGMLSGHFASFAEGATLKDEIRVYYFLLMRRINEAWWTSGAPQGTFANPAAVNLHISRDGKVIGCELLESSGNREQDKALLAAVKAAEPLPPLPSSYLQRTFNAPIRFVPPLRLMLPGFGNKRPLGINHGN